MMKISRRAFLFSSSGVLGTLFSSNQAIAYPSVINMPTAGRIGLIEEVVGPIDSIIEIAHAITEKNWEQPLSSWSEAFLDRLFSIQPGLGTQKDIEALKFQYRHRLSDDFECTRTSIIDGWVLSETEVEVILNLFRLSE